MNELTADPGLWIFVGVLTIAIILAIYFSFKAIKDVGRI